MEYVLIGLALIVALYLAPLILEAATIITAAISTVFEEILGGDR